MKKVLTIAGSDCSGGAGIQADIKTMTVHKVYAMSVITALTAQNTTGVTDIMNATPEFVGAQLDAVFTDIFPDAVKIGMVSSAKIIEVIADKLCEYKAKNIVLDPVMISTSGHRLIHNDAQKFLVERLMPLADVITPNIPEAEVLSDISINSKEDMLRAAELISAKCECAVLLKGGHMVCDASDLLFDNGKIKWFETKKIDNPNTHGTGCTLSSAIACNLAQGKTMEEAVKNAKEYLTVAIGAMLDLGKGHGPLDHTYKMETMI
ncbi:MAG: bifunctional hydroxymethylpyrimidine kinase/phosphomethylpyrimidine kinase [Clostridia bacterium]|nr:bifunctional hydroxymethylpyrimidine kinase/phosphomethylpyrimidine kinase [Clostridia bacterium]